MEMNENYKCPWCGCEEMVYGVQTDKARIKPAKPISIGEEKVIHVICRQCGTIVRSYVQHPEKFV